MSDIIFGIDYSMSTPAMCHLADDKSFANSHHYFLSNRKRDVSPPGGNIHSQLHKPYKSEIERFSNIADFFVDQIKIAVGSRSSVPVVYLEDYSMGSKGRVFNIAENTAILKYKLNEIHVAVLTVPPTVLKKFASGKGNSDKDAMYRAFLARGGNPELMKFYYDKTDAKVASPVSDIVDAYFLALYGTRPQEKA